MPYFGHNLSSASCCALVTRPLRLTKLRMRRYAGLCALCMDCVILFKLISTVRLLSLICVLKWRLLLIEIRKIKMFNQREVFIIDGARTPFLKAEGGPGPFAASDLAVAAGRPLLMRQPFEPEAFDEVVVGCVAPSEDEANIGRVIALRLGCGTQTPAWTVQRNCASGMQAVDTAATNIAIGRSDLVLAGGCEAMSRSPVLLNKKMVGLLADWDRAKTFSQKLSAASKIRPDYLKPVIGLVRGLRDPVVGLSMGQTAEVVADRFNINREDMDAFAVQSHIRLADAQDNGRMSEIETIVDPAGKAYDFDNGIRRDSSMEKLAKLKPVFDREFGNVTAGNSAQITDGAAWLILASKKAVQDHQLNAIGRIVDSEWSGLDPRLMGLGPVHATTPMLLRQNLLLDDIDFWEINEAFAAQVLGCVEAWKDTDYCKHELGLDNAFGELDMSRLNMDGGSVAIGHPVGASGTRIILHLLNVLAQHNKQVGVATICIGGGQGGSVLLERV